MHLISVCVDCIHIIRNSGVIGKSLYNLIIIVILLEIYKRVTEAEVHRLRARNMKRNIRTASCNNSLWQNAERNKRNIYLNTRIGSKVVVNKCFKRNSLVTSCSYPRRDSSFLLTGGAADSGIVVNKRRDKRSYLMSCFFKSVWLIAGSLYISAGKNNFIKLQRDISDFNHPRTERAYIIFKGRKTRRNSIRLFKKAVNLYSKSIEYLAFSAGICRNRINICFYRLERIGNLKQHRFKIGNAFKKFIVTVCIGRGTGNHYDFTVDIV